MRTENRIVEVCSEILNAYGVSLSKDLKKPLEADAVSREIKTYSGPGYFDLYKELKSGMWSITFSKGRPANINDLPYIIHEVSHVLFTPPWEPNPDCASELMAQLSWERALFRELLPSFPEKLSKWESFHDGVCLGHRTVWSDLADKINGKSCLRIIYDFADLTAEAKEIFYALGEIPCKKAGILTNDGKLNPSPPNWTEEVKTLWECTDQTLL